MPLSCDAKEVLKRAKLSNLKRNPGFCGQWNDVLCQINRYGSISKSLWLESKLITALIPSVYASFLQQSSNLQKLQKKNHILRVSIVGSLENNVIQDINDILMMIADHLLTQTIVMKEIKKEFVKFMKDPGLSQLYQTSSISISNKLSYSQIITRQM